METFKSWVPDGAVCVGGGGGGGYSGSAGYGFGVNTSDVATVTVGGNSDYWGRSVLEKCEPKYIAYPEWGPVEEKRTAEFADYLRVLRGMGDSADVSSNRKEEGPMENLYEIYVVSKTREVVVDRAVVTGVDEDEAKFNAGVDSAIRKANLKPKDVTVICRCLGQFRVEKEAQAVKVVKE